MPEWKQYIVLIAVVLSCAALIIAVSVWIGSMGRGSSDKEIGRQQVYYHLSTEMFARWRSCADVASYNGENPAVACDRERAALDLVLQNSKRSKLVGGGMYRYIHDPASGPIDDTGKTYNVDEVE